MLVLRILGFIVLIAGIGSILFSNYITEQVNAGKIQIAQGERAVNRGNQLFSLNPIAKEVGKGITAPAEKKIEKGKEQVAYYQDLAQTLKTAGISGIIIGAGMAIISFFGRKKKR